MQFIDQFYYELYTKEVFDKYRKGVIDCLKKPHPDIYSEASYLFSRMKTLTRKEHNKIEWGRKDALIEWIENDNNCSHEKVKAFYKNMFNPTPFTASVTPEMIAAFKRAATLQPVMKAVEARDVAQFAQARHLKFADLIPVPESTL